MPNKKTKAVKEEVKKQGISQTLAIVCLILNIVILPGLGSLIGGKTKAGIWQIVLCILGIPLSIIIIGIPMIIASWIWGIVTGVDLIKKSY